MRGKASEVLTLPENFSLSGAIQSHDGIDQGGFTRPIGSNDTDQLLRLDLHRYRPQRGGCTVVNVDVLKFKHGKNRVLSDLGITRHGLRPNRR